MAQLGLAYEYHRAQVLLISKIYALRLGKYRPRVRSGCATAPLNFPHQFGTVQVLLSTTPDDRENACSVKDGLLSHGILLRNTQLGNDETAQGELDEESYRERRLIDDPLLQLMHGSSTPSLTRDDAIALTSKV